MGGIDMINKVYITVWGNPYAWKSVNYKYGGQTCNSTTTLKIVDQVDNPSKIIIIALDSVIEAGQVVDPKNDEISCKNYEEIQNLAYEKISNYIKQKINEDIMKKTEICVSFSIGEFKKIKIDGHSTDFYFDIFVKLSKLLTNILLENPTENIEKQEIEIIIDISHGINFMPVIAYSVTRIILNILCFLFNKIKLKVINSDPFIIPDENTYLNINTIEETTISPRIYVYKDKVISKCLYLSNFLNPEQKKNLGEQISALFKEKSELYMRILLFIFAFYNKLPLHTIHYLPKMEDVQNLIDIIVQKHLESIEITTNENGKKVIKRQLYFGPIVENLSKALILTKILKYLNIEPKDEISIDEIKKINDKLLKKFNIEKNRIDIEIYKIEKYKDHITSDYQTYMQIIKNGEITESNKSVDKRNFFAHAGFEYNSIKLKKFNDKIFIKINEDLREKIENHILES